MNRIRVHSVSGIGLEDPDNNLSVLQTIFLVIDDLGAGLFVIRIFKAALKTCSAYDRELKAHPGELLDVIGDNGNSGLGRQTFLAYQNFLHLHTSSD